MKKIILILVLICASIVVNGRKIPDTIEAVQVVESLSDYLKENPDMKLIPLKKENSKHTNNLMRVTKEPIRYTLGVPHPADVRLAEGSNTFYYPTLQDVKLQLSYPENGGVGGIVNFVEILVDQDSDIGNVYVVAGSVGEKYIRILVEAKYVRYFSYRASFYGVLFGI